MRVPLSAALGRQCLGSSSKTALAAEARRQRHPSIRTGQCPRFVLIFRLHRLAVVALLEIPAPFLVWLSLATIAATGAVIRGVGVRSRLAGTTLVAVLPWMVAAAIAWGGWCLGLWWQIVQHEPRWSGILDRIAYLAAVLSLCPPMVVLGARRPTNRAWTGFVIVPMIVVLCWPMLTTAVSGSWERRFKIESPQLMGLLLVVVMSYGNYLGGRLTFPAFLAAAGVLFVGIDASQQKAYWLDGPGVVVIALLILAAGLLSCARRLRTWPPPADRFDGVWREFSLLFGLVWSRRLLDRINAIAEKQQWPGRLHADGFHWERPLDDVTQRQVDHALRWLLRRFVDPKWLDARLGAAATMDTPLTVDT